MISKIKDLKSIINFNGKYLSFIRKYYVKSYAQEGEDLILKKLFEPSKRKGFYIDVGAHHPKRFSNTFLFYKLGWTGINIDAMPGSMKLFNLMRPKDINIEVPLSDKKHFLSYYSFTEPALNTLSVELGEYRIREENNKLLFKKKIETDTLESILDTYLPQNITIDFLTVDVEGLDFQVLKSNNWAKYKPKVVVVEAYDKNIISVLKSDINNFLVNLNYELIAKTPMSLFYISKE